MSENMDQVKGLIEKLKAKDSRVKGNLVKFVTRAAIRIEREAKKAMQETPTISLETRSAMAESGKSVGRKVGKSGKIHLPSEPGNAPAIDTGTLVKRITHSVDKNDVSARVGTNVEYGLYLEHGTSHMLPRPWLRPAIDAAHQANQEDFQTVMGEGGPDA